MEVGIINNDQKADLIITVLKFLFKLLDINISIIQFKFIPYVILLIFSKLIKNVPKVVRYVLVIYPNI